MSTVVPIILKNIVKQGKKEQLKLFVFFIYNEEGRETLKDIFIMLGHKGEKQSKLDSIFFLL